MKYILHIPLLFLFGYNYNEQFSLFLKFTTVIEKMHPQLMKKRKKLHISILNQREALIAL